MPAYRSEAEAEIRRAVVDRLRVLVPGCRIINEINAASFGNRIDVLAVGLDRMVAVEIKSEKDKLDRLPDQIKAMRSVTPLVVSALHDKFFERGIGDGFILPPRAAIHSQAWRYAPEDESREFHWSFRHWRQPRKVLPEGALLMLWREELHAICHGLKLKGVAKMTMEQAADEIRFRLTGEQVNAHIFRTLRARKCVEADEPMED